MRSFLDCFDRLVQQAGVADVLEVGCGEGRLSVRMAQQGLRVRACDVSEDIVELARKDAAGADLPLQFRTVSLFELSPAVDTAGLVVCCEVLEHVDEPQRAVDVLASLASPYLLASVPREPLWRILNLCRGKYLAQLGNTPGHIQHWSRSGFLKLLGRRFELLSVQTPTPWTMALCKIKR
jgi:2-polyprenyl-3-methyl-5-hydroxy-6-metoxy-1,4-benzoquinol methylase